MPPKGARRSFPWNRGTNQTGFTMDDGESSSVSMHSKRSHHNDEDIKDHEEQTENQAATNNPGK